MSLGLASCDQYPDGNGSPEVAPGTYDLVVSQTVGLLPDGGTVAGAWGVAVTTVTVVADGEAVVQDPTACGASTDGLETLASQEGNPAPLGLEVLSGGDELVVRATNTGTGAIAATTGHPTVVIARDGVIVGGLDGHDDIGLAADLAVGGHADYDATTNAFDCTTIGVGEHANTGDGDPLPAGEYEVWAVMTFFGDGLTPTARTAPAPSSRAARRRSRSTDRAVADRGAGRSSRALRSPGARPDVVPGKPSGRVAREGDRPVVGRARLDATVHPAQQLGTRGVERVVPVERVPEGVERGQCDVGAVDLGDRDGAVEGDDGRAVEADELVVEGDDLRPVGVAGSRASVCTALIAASSW